MSKSRTLPILGAVAMAVATTLTITQAQAYSIIMIQNPNGSPVVDLSAIENGSYVIANIFDGSPSAGSINVLNDTGSNVTSLDLFYNGNADAGLNFQFSGAYTGSCTISTGGSVISSTTSNGCETAQTALATASYEYNLTSISPRIGTTSPSDEFNIGWSSFSATDQSGCIAGTSTNTRPTCAVRAPPIGHGLPVLLAVGGILFGAKLLESLKRRHLHAA